MRGASKNYQTIIGKVGARAGKLGAGCDRQGRDGDRLQENYRKIPAGRHGRRRDAEIAGKMPENYRKIQTGKQKGAGAAGARPLWGRPKAALPVCIFPIIFRYLFLQFLRPACARDGLRVFFP